ncbi:hypothetical protein BN7_415 [Wickerhamomyces ciferrii]|uniref:Structure-specific endonuclease subunit SLX4 n=1 Tax=Wickerhamomyces ciferrii (strain ATCC 14091 / BCRC 22168 / CBS 111 / JCM 3599 / NBRC 0793 / NRRL Y-1031 F-60-10) TaxID=1206466 RepID=K0KDA5_WICCF|nr:uncharacterized protein BN7_415 [Wickerhamomyces ciferrii]CCH40881.1 hypothetical protein BN7_415 [Wickerhamomyces ciferrii]
MSISGTYGEEVLCSSPIGSIIDVSRDHISEDEHQDDHDDGKIDTKHSILFKESDFNIYSYNPILTQDLVFKDDIPKPKSKESTVTNSNNDIINLSSDYSKIIDQESSEIQEVSQKEYKNSQKLKYESIKSSQIDFNGLDENEYNDELNDQELRSNQTPITSPTKSYGYIQSSSPIITQHETQPTSSQPLPLIPQNDHEFSLAPSAQLTSFRMQSPKKILSNKTTPTRKRTMLLPQESFNIPHLLSPTKSSPLRTQVTDSMETQSLYCTARQTESSPMKNSKDEEFEKRTTKVRFKGLAKAKSSSPFNNYQTKIIPTKRDTFEIPDSSDDEDQDISIIEITRTIKKPKKSILQVPSSPGAFSSPSRINSILDQDQDHNQSPIKEDDSIPNTIPNSLQSQSQVLNSTLEELPTEELKRKIIQYGLKPAKSRLKMIKSIQEIDVFLGKDSLEALSQSQNITNSQNIVKSEIFKIIDETILTNTKLHEKIYTFEPIPYKELNEFLDEQGVIINYDMLKEWCDFNSICLIEEDKDKDKEKVN